MLNSYKLVYIVLQNPQKGNYYSLIILKNDFEITFQRQARKRRVDIKFQRQARKSKIFSFWLLAKEIG